MTTHLASFRLLCAAALMGQGVLLDAQSLSPVKDLPKTIGSVTQDAGPLSVCALADTRAITLAYNTATARGAKRFVLGWELKVDPPGELAKNLVITNVKRIGVLAKVNCKTVLPLPAGGVDAMQAHTPYALVDKAPDWKTGFTSLVMTARNDNLPANEFVPRLKHHVKLVTQLFEPKGMDGYVVYIGDDFEWGYLHWVDEATSKKAFATPEGATGPKDSATFQHTRGANSQIFHGDVSPR